MKVVLMLLLAFSLAGCSETPDMPLQKWTLENEYLAISWESQQGLAFQATEVRNKKDGQQLDLAGVDLFAIELADGDWLNNRDFVLMGEVVRDALPVDSETEQSGKQLSARLRHKQSGIEVIWRAALHDQRNYVRQVFTIKNLGEVAVDVAAVHLWRGDVNTARPAGDVLGSVIVADNTFFGYEHPTSYSEAVDYRYLNYISDSTPMQLRDDGHFELFLDVTESIFDKGEFLLDYQPDKIKSGFNVLGAALLENSQVVSEDMRPQYGAEPLSSYVLNLPTKKPGALYQLRLTLKNPKGNSARLFIKQYHPGRLGFYVRKERVFQPGESMQESSVVGVSAPGAMRRSFLAYVEHERARPYRQFLHYNSWYDLSEDNVAYTLEQAAEVIDNWGKKFIQPHNIDFGGFALDDGWDDLNDLWRFNREDFPQGFAPLAQRARKLNTGIGAWMSPFGGYAEPKKRRVETARRDGFETTDKGLSLAGPKYYQRFLDSALEFIHNHEVDYFKFDGFGGSDPKYLPEMEAATRLVKQLREANPDVFINVTTGTWPSPFWLLTADSTWRGGWDVNQAGEGNRSQQWITYRDGMLYNNVVKRAPLYPLNSIMHHGIVYANRSWGKDYTTDNDQDFADQVYSYFGSGTALQELYISHDRMNAEKWKILADGARWAKANEATLVDTHWVGGDPFNGDLYGWASWADGKGILVLRNPKGISKKETLNIAQALEVPADQLDERVIRSIFSDTKYPLNQAKLEVELKPFEVQIFQIEKPKGSH